MLFKKIISIASIIPLIFFSNLASAQLRNVTLETRNGFDVGGQLFDYKYEEPGVMNTKGTKLGGFVDLTQKTGNSWYWTAGARYARGDVTYTGSGIKENNPDHLWEFRFVMGKDLKLFKHVLSPYVGGGYRNLYNDLRGITSTGAVGYRRDSQYLYIPLGATYRIPLGLGSRLSTTVEYDYLIEGRQKSYLATDAGASIYGDPINKQRKGHGAKFNIAIEQNHWAFGVFYNHWDIDDSQVNSGVYEPKNNTNETGIQVKYHF